MISVGSFFCGFLPTALNQPPLFYAHMVQVEFGRSLRWLRPNLLNPNKNYSFKERLMVMGAHAKCKNENERQETVFQMMQSSWPALCLLRAFRWSKFFTRSPKARYNINFWPVQLLCRIIFITDIKSIAQQLNRVRKMEEMYLPALIYRLYIYI